jgi:hypothetical protein
VLLVAVPYALRSEEAQRLAGREASEFLLAEQLESDVQEVVETKVLEEMEAQGLVSSEEGVTPAIVDGASTFTDNNATQVVLVTQNGTGKGLKAVSTTGNAVDAESTGTSGTNFTLLGINRSTGGRALFGFASATSGATIAAAGRADSPLGIGFFGQALSTTGPTVGVQAEVRSPNGIAGLFANTAGGKLLLGKSAGTEVFSVDGSGNVTATAFVGDVGILAGTANTGVGESALANNTTGTANTAVGASALDDNTEGDNNTAVGWKALLLNTANNNTAVGVSALKDNQGGERNTAVGRSALFSNTTGTLNTALGGSALGSNQTGGSNTAVGTDALIASTGSSNIALGISAGSSLTSGGGNIYIGNSGVSSESDTIRVGSSQTDAFIAGIRGVTTGVADAITVLIDSAGQLGTVSSSRRTKEDIRDMREASAGLERLRPVVFRYRKPFANGAKPLQYGLIAEEVAEVYPELVAYDAEGEPETVLYRFLAPMLLSELQRQQAALRELKAENDSLQEHRKAQDKQVALLLEAVKEQQAQLQELRAELAVVKAQLDRPDRMTLAEVHPQD